MMILRKFPALLEAAKAKSHRISRQPPAVKKSAQKQTQYKAKGSGF